MSDLSHVPLSDAELHSQQERAEAARWQNAIDRAKQFGGGLRSDDPADYQLHAQDFIAGFEAGEESGDQRIRELRAQLQESLHLLRVHNAGVNADTARYIREVEALARG